MPLAAASLTGSVILILWAALYGFMAPVGILAARAFGAGNDARVASVVAHGRWLGIGIGVASTLVMVALLPLGMAGAVGIRIGQALGALRALRDNRWPTTATLRACWLLALPLGWLLAVPLRFGAERFWAGFALGLAVAALLLLMRFLRTGARLTATP